MEQVDSCCQQLLWRGVGLGERAGDRSLVWHREQVENTGLVSTGSIFEDAHQRKGILSPLKARGTRHPTQVAPRKSFVHLGELGTETPSSTYLQKAFAGKTVPPSIWTLVWKIAATSYHKFSCIETTQFLILQCERSEVQSQSHWPKAKVAAELILLEAQRQAYFFCLFLLLAAP